MIGILPNTKPCVTQGKSVYEIAVENGFDGDPKQWLESLKGQKGEKGDAGQNGKSAYEIAVENGFLGEGEQHWLHTLKGQKGDRGEQGIQGQKGEKGDAGQNGKSAYEIALEHIELFTDRDVPSNEKEWLQYLKGRDGYDGQTAYEIAVENGFVGSQTQWLASLKGQKGDRGEQGIQGIQGQKGEKGDAGQNGKSAYEIAVENGFVGSQTQWLASLKGEKGETGTRGRDGATPNLNLPPNYEFGHRLFFETDYVQLDEYYIRNRGILPGDIIFKRDTFYMCNPNSYPYFHPVLSLNQGGGNIDSNSGYVTSY